MLRHLPSRQLECFAYALLRAHEELQVVDPVRRPPPRITADVEVRHAVVRSRGEVTRRYAAWRSVGVLSCVSFMGLFLRNELVLLFRSGPLCAFPHTNLAASDR